MDLVRFRIGGPHKGMFETFVDRTEFSPRGGYTLPPDQHSEVTWVGFYRPICNELDEPTLMQIVGVRIIENVGGTQKCIAQGHLAT